MQVIWFKHDLRVDDHWPLAQASAAGPCLFLYVYELELIHAEEFDASHLRFINESLVELDRRLRELGGRLTFRVGAMPDVLSALHSEHGIDALWSHEETGNKATYDRDLRVAAWVKQYGIVWNEIPQNGVIRRLKSRDGWSKQREAFLMQPMANVPTKLTHPTGVDPGRLQTPEDLGLSPTEKTNLQPGGEDAARETLRSFLFERGQDYSREMSSPVTAPDSCSRLSAYLAWGCISMKRVVHELRDRQGHLRELKASGEPVGGWLKSLRAFESRLSWHCHFMQKLEDEPAIEFENMSRAYDGLREDQFNQSYFDAWCEGRTGYPMVDACMRALHQHSWINFRMRAMLVSFASYHLWLHWRPTAVYLARHFLDFEPGIHFSQFQMQSGTTGINTVRIYSPIKQVVDQDPTGKFIRRYVPELAAVPNEHLAEPHKMSLSQQAKIGCLIGTDYPPPIVEHSVAYKAARDRIYAVRRMNEAKSEAKRIVMKHGSRKRTPQSR
jgi:deoxyribodipyrimidine photo-lyase